MLTTMIPEAYVHVYEQARGTVCYAFAADVATPPPPPPPTKPQFRCFTLLTSGQDDGRASLRPASVHIAYSTSSFFFPTSLNLPRLLARLFGCFVGFPSPLLPPRSP